MQHSLPRLAFVVSCCFLLASATTTGVTSLGRPRSTPQQTATTSLLETSERTNGQYFFMGTGVPPPAMQNMQAMQYGQAAPVPSVAVAAVAPAPVVTQTNIHPNGAIVHHHHVMSPATVAVAGGVLPRIHNDNLDREAEEVKSAIAAQTELINQKKNYLAELQGLINDKQTEAQKGTQEVTEDEVNLQRLKLKAEEIEHKKREQEINNNLQALKAELKEEEAAETNLRHELQKRTATKDELKKKIKEAEKTLKEIQKKIQALIEQGAGAAVPAAPASQTAAEQPQQVAATEAVPNESAVATESAEPQQSEPEQQSESEEEQEQSEEQQ